MKRFFLILLSGVSLMHAAGPFSFKEIDSLEKCELVKPQFLRASDAIELAYYKFVTPANKAVVIFYAGAGLYGNHTYQWVAKNLNEKYNIGCYIFDLRGHGHSQGVRGDAPSVERVWTDVAEAVSFVKRENKTAKIYLTGHSSGAGLLINYAAHTETKVEDGYIFLAPYLGPQSNTLKEHKNADESFVKSMRLWVYILGSIFPRSFIAHFNAVFFNYPKALLKADPLIVPAYTYTMSCATTPYEIAPVIQKIDKPVGLFIGSNDEQFLPEAVIAYKKMINAPVVAEIVENAAHLSLLLDAPQLIAGYIKNQSL